jgi:undecaprenyl diphosphate synthase
MNPIFTASQLPKHVAIIMDGNGRWAKKHHLPRQEGHKKGAATLQNVVETFIIYKIPYLTLYAFSSENWNRPKFEVEGLFALLGERLEEGVQFAQQKGIRICHFGRLDKLPQKVQQKLREAIETTRTNKNITMGLAFNYGSRDEIVDATKEIVRSGIRADEINESVITSHLYTSELPDPDLVIRTGGEMRLSNFLLWQSAYSEMYFTKTLWPDFNREEIDKALSDFSKRQRRFGKLDDNG